MPCFAYALLLFRFTCFCDIAVETLAGLNIELYLVELLGAIPALAQVIGSFSKWYAKVGIALPCQA
jgi:hypothetical protein